MLFQYTVELLFIVISHDLFNNTIDIDIPSICRNSPVSGTNGDVVVKLSISNTICILADNSPIAPTALRQ